MRFKIQHPEDISLHAAYGWDRALGYFVDILPRRALEIPRVEYDALQPCYDQRRPLRGALDVLVRHGFIVRHHLDEAFESMQYVDHQDMEESVRRCAEVLENFKSAAA